jgi:hypothetical protein
MKDADHLELDEVKSFARDIHHDAQRLDTAFEEMVDLDQRETSRATT